MSNRVPTTIVTGFLGSGKTTIIGHLIDDLQARHQQLVYIKNEVGDQDLDGQLLRTKQVVAKELLNGCICCTLVGPFLSAITEVIKTYHPDRILIEASGAADPAALALMVSAHPQLRRDAVLSVIDVVNFEGYQDLTVTARNQTHLTDIILFNKIELVDLARKEAVVGYVRELNTHSPIIETPQGRVGPELVFGVTSSELDTLLSQTITAADSASHHHLETDELESFSCQLMVALTQTQVETWLTTLPARIFRVKGVFQTPTGEHILVNRVATRATFEPTTLSLEKKGRLIFIGHQIGSQETEIARQLQELGHFFE